MKKFNLLPVITNLCMVAFWFIESTSGCTSYIQIILNSVVFPIFLIIFNIIKWKKRKTTILKSILYISLVIIADALIHYSTWGLWGGDFFFPDPMTVGLILYLETIYPIILVVVVFSLISIVGRVKTWLRKLSKGRIC